MSTEIAAGMTVMCTNKGILPIAFFRQTCLSSFVCVSDTLNELSPISTASLVQLVLKHMGIFFFFFVRITGKLHFRFDIEGKKKTPFQTQSSSEWNQWHQRSADHHFKFQLWDLTFSRC